MHMATQGGACVGSVGAKRNGAASGAVGKSLAMPCAASIGKNISGERRVSSHAPGTHIPTDEATYDSILMDADKANSFIGSSWRATLVALCAMAREPTTRTGSGTTTDSATLNSGSRGSPMVAVSLILWRSLERCSVAIGREFIGRQLLAALHAEGVR